MAAWNKLLPLLAGLLLAGGSLAQSPAHLSVDHSAMTSPDNSWCIGRFRFSLPPGWRPTGRKQSIYRVDVQVRSGGAEALWQERLAKVRQLAPPPGATAALIRTFELERGVPAVWYRSSDVFTHIISLEALKPVPEGTLMLAREAVVGKEAAAEQLVKNVVRAYAPDQRQGFCLERGAIVTEPGQNEETRISFDNPSLPGASLSLDTHTVRQPDLADRGAGIREQAGKTGADGEQVAIRRDSVRKAANLEGREMLLSQSGGKRAPSVQFLWRYAGSALRADQPEIIFEATGDAGQGRALGEAWEMLFGSLRPVPLASR
ncbi:MAG: T6SS immunity protein Tli4 family protein [Rhodocyclaceae bacterium]|nr:T6SS immunity protein Tli4 family protein [Rhodocyclaceae bacterium]